MVLPFSPRFNKNHQWILLSLFGNLVIHLIIGLSYYNPIDFILQLEAAKEIARGKLLYRDIGQIIVNNSELPRPQYPPLYLYTLGFLIALIGVETFTWQLAKLFLIAFNLIVGLLVYYIILSYIRPHPKAQTIAIIALNWFLLNPSTLGIILGGFHENFMLFFVLLGFILFKHTQYIQSGLCFGLSLLIKPIAGVYMLPLLVWGIHSKDLKSIMIWIAAGLTFLCGSLPFLLLAPEAYLSDVFLIHTNRPDPSMSFYTYLFSEISTTLIPFFIQLAVFGVYILLFIKKKPPTNTKQVIEATLPFITIFMALNRILHPHYIPFFFPFFTFSLFLLITERYSPQTSRMIDISILGLFVSLFLVYLGSGWWSILWFYEGYETYMVNPLFFLSSIICVIGLVTTSVTSLLSMSGFRVKNVEITF